MSRSKGITISLLTALVLFVSLLPCQGCREQKGELILLVPKMTLVKKNIIDEDELKRELKVVKGCLSRSPSW
jgi:hypothetical protein